MNHSALVLLPALAGVLTAQSLLPATIAASDPRIPVHTRVDQPGEPAYGTWAAGSAYKASFHGGMTFYPALGPDYPHNQPLAWRTTSVRVGTNDLLLDATSPRVTHRDYRVEYALGPVVEAYDVLDDGLEQTFVIERRPTGEGDLRIIGKITTALWTEPVEDHVGDLQFRDARGTPLVRYGRAVAIDADGDRFSVMTSCSGNTITLRLPAAALAAADFPLVVDPLLAATTTQTLSSTVALGDIDAAAEGLNASHNGAFCVTRHFSATDADVFAYVSDSSLGAPLARFTDLAVSTSAEHARLGFIPATNKWVLCYQSLQSTTQTMQLRVAMFGGGPTSSFVPVSNPHPLAAGTHEWRPAVGGIVAGGSGASALIVFQQETGTPTFANTTTSKVLGMLYDTSTATGAFGPTFLIRGLPGEDVERPAVNRAAEGGAAFTWLVVGQTSSNLVAIPIWQLFGHMVTNAGAPFGSPWGSDLAVGHEMGPVVDGRAGRYCVACVTANGSIPKPTDVLGTAVHCERINWAPGSGAPTGGAANYPVQTLQTNSFRVLEAGGIAFDGGTLSHWAIAWRSSSSSPAVYASRVGYRGEPLQVPDVVETTGLFIPGWPTVVHDDDIAQTTVAYQRHVGSSMEVRRRIWDLPTPPSPTLSPSNCSNVLVAWSGPAVPATHNQRIGSQFTQIAATGAPANSLHLMLVATATANVPVIDPILGTNCALLVPFSGPDYLGYLPPALGAGAAWPLPLPESLSSMTIHFQDWVLEPANGRLWGSRRLSVPLLR
jgi:hypothetical protein